uniref:Putative secreted protein n=1 Tax=Amblyomma americanum TaxID=6943 RepID=A0A0C9SDV5_AMBAM
MSCLTMAFSVMSLSSACGSLKSPNLEIVLWMVSARLSFSFSGSSRITSAAGRISASFSFAPLSLLSLEPPPNMLPNGPSLLSTLPPMADPALLARFFLESSSPETATLMFSSVQSWQRMSSNSLVLSLSRWAMSNAGKTDRKASTAKSCCGRATELLGERGGINWP